MVYVNTNKNTQTVKLCTARNLRGEYERYYRIFPPYVLSQDEVEPRVGHFTSLDELDQWLVEDRRASRENGYEVAPATTSGAASEEDSDPEAMGAAVSEVLDLLASAKYRPDDDPWLSTATESLRARLIGWLRNSLSFRTFIASSTQYTPISFG
jgi:hypothetical protein